jgi:tetratricopeptide (TPR) repeat protein
MRNHSTSDISGENSRTGRIGAWVLAAGIAGAALAAGTVHTVPLCAVVGVLAAATVLLGWTAEPTRPRSAATLLLVTACALTAYTALQCVPLPISWLARIAPHNAEVWSRALSPLGEEGPRWAPISLDPTATRIEVLKGVAYILAFVSALRVARRRRGTAFLSEVIIATGLVLAFAALLHPALGARKLYGIWEPDNSDAGHLQHLAPLFNPNNLAGYINVALCLALAATFSSEPRVPRPILLAVVVVLAGTQVWVASRGGVATMVLGTILVIAMLRTARMRERRGSTMAWIVAAVLGMAAVFVIVLANSEQASSELLNTESASKLHVIREAMRMVPQYPIWGIGRGAFESAFPAFRDAGGYWTSTHPENFVAQWLIEWGIPLGGAGLLAIAVGLRPGALLARSTAATGAWAAIVALAVQNLVDLGSEIPGLVIAPVVCAAMVVGGTAGREPRWRIERWADAPRATGIVAAAFAACALLATTMGLGRELHDDQRTLRVAATREHSSRDEMDTLARAAMIRHPAEPYFPFITAWWLARGQDGSPIPWIDATLERAPLHGPAHLVLARWLVSRSPSQARLEYRLAMQQAPSLIWTIMQEVPRQIRGYDDAMDFVRDSELGAFILHTLVPGLEARLPATCHRLDEELAERAPEDPDLALRNARAAVEDLEAKNGAPWCEAGERSACASVALNLANRAQSLRQGQCEPYLLGARADLATGNVERALASLSDAADRVIDRVGCLQETVRLAADAHDDARETEALGKIVNSACGADAECANNLAWAANVEQQRGNIGRALATYKQAYARAPDATNLLEQMAPLAASMGLHGEAASDYEQLARKRPAELRWIKAADDERKMALGAGMHM